MEKEIIESLQNLKKLNEDRENLKTLEENIKTKSKEIEEAKARKSLIISSSKDIEEDKIKELSEEYENLIKEKDNKKEELEIKFNNSKNDLLNSIDNELKKYKRKNELDELKDSYNTYMDMAKKEQEKIENISKVINESENIDGLMISTLATAKDAKIENEEKAKKVQEEINNYKELDSNIEQYRDLEYLQMRINLLFLDNLNEKTEEEFCNKYFEEQKTAENSIIEENTSNEIPQQEEQKTEINEEIDLDSILEQYSDSKTNYSKEERDEIVNSILQENTSKEPEPKKEEQPKEIDSENVTSKKQSKEKTLSEIYELMSDLEKQVESRPQSVEEKPVEEKSVEGETEQKSKSTNVSKAKPEIKKAPETKKEPVTEVKPKEKTAEEKLENSIKEIKEKIDKATNPDMKKDYMAMLKTQQKQLENIKANKETAKKEEKKLDNKSEVKKELEEQNITKIDIIAYDESTINRPFIKYEVNNGEKIEKNDNNVHYYEGETKDEIIKGYLKEIYPEMNFKSNEGLQELKKYEKADVNIVKILRNNKKLLNDYISRLNGIDIENNDYVKISYDISKLSKANISKEEKKQLEKNAYEHRNIAKIKKNLLQSVKFALWNFNEKRNNDKSIKSFPITQAPVKTEELEEDIDGIYPETSKKIDDMIKEKNNSKEPGFKDQYKVNTAEIKFPEISDFDPELAKNYEYSKKYGQQTKRSKDSSKDRE